MILRVIYFGTTAEDLDPRVFDMKYFNKSPLSIGWDHITINLNSYPRFSDEDIRNEITRNFTDYSDSLLVIVVPTWYMPMDITEYFGYTDELWNGKKYIVLAAETIKKRALIFHNIFAKWVLKHELGHYKGLEHHKNIFCIMNHFNVSFGRFCRKCSKQLIDAR